MNSYVSVDPSRPLIVDISRYQNDPNTPEYPDFKKMKSLGVAGIILKGGQATWEDRDFRVYWKLAKEAFLPRGIYWYYDNSVHPETQAERFLELPLEEAELGIWLDLEDKKDKPYKGWKNWYNFIVRVQKSLPRVKFGIYTANYYWLEYTKQSNIPNSSLKYFKQFPLWIANYKVDAPLVPEPWDSSSWVLWQFTDLLDGKKYGVESFELDGNYFNGTYKDYYEYFGISGDAPEVTTPDDEELPNMTRTPKYNCVARFDAKVRATPDTNNVSNTKIFAGTAFQISDIVPDRLDPNNPAKKWGWIIGGQHDGKYTALEYPNNSNPISTYELISGENPPPPPIVGNEIDPMEIVAAITPEGKLLVKISLRGLELDSIWVDSDEYIRKD